MSSPVSLPVSSGVTTSTQTLIDFERRPVHSAQKKLYKIGTNTKLYCVGGLIACVAIGVYYFKYKYNVRHSDPALVDINASTNSGYVNANALKRFA